MHVPLKPYRMCCYYVFAFAGWGTTVFVENLFNSRHLPLPALGTLKLANGAPASRRGFGWPMTLGGGAVSVPQTKSEASVEDVKPE